MSRFAEEQVRPKILERFRAQGIELEETHQSVEKDGKPFSEINLLLVNTTFSVVVEVKSTLRKKEYRQPHLARLTKLQKTSNRSIKKIIICGAMAGIITADDIVKYTMKKGLYVLKTKGDNEIGNKADFKPSTRV